MKVIISGGGIGGLTAALCFIHHGHEVTVLERAAELGEVGAGIQVSPNAMKVFEALGMSNALAANAFRPESIETRMGISGRYIFKIPLADRAIKNWGSPYLHIYRPDYIEALLKAVKNKGEDIVRLNHEVTGYEQTGDGIIAKLTNGRQVLGEVLIGADGIHSPTRTQMLGVEKPQFTGNVAWRAVVPIEKLGEDIPNPTACAWMGPGRHCVTYRLRGGKLANLVAVVERDDWTKESWTEKGTKEEALADFKGWNSTIINIIKNAQTLYRWALFDRPSLERWVDGRVALLGDAAHPMLPFMAQGAAMAVEDAWVVAKTLSEPNVKIEEALKTYQHLRYDRASHVQAGSRGNAKTFHQSSRLGQIKTYGPMWLAGKIAPAAIHKRQNYLYGHDVTQL